jgi:hypothetical protein
LEVIMGGFRRGILLGLGIGYLQGAKAGRQRYDQIKESMDKLQKTPAVKQITDTAVNVANTGLSQGKEVVNKALGNAKGLFGGGNQSNQKAAGTTTSGSTSSGSASSASGASGPKATVTKPESKASDSK